MTETNPRSEKVGCRTSIIKAKEMHASTLIPARSHSKELRDSVRAIGVQQPIIVRPSPTEAGKFEIIDGGGRAAFLEPEQDVIVDIRELTDTEAFKISEATSKRDERTASENAEFYTAYLNAVREETGEEGAAARVAKETGITESQLSQYSAINEFFTKLRQADPEHDYHNLRSMGVNRLYTLAKLKNYSKLAEIAREVEAKAQDITAEGIAEIVQHKPIIIDEEEAGLETWLSADEDEEKAQAPASPVTFDSRLSTMPEKVSLLIKELSETLAKTPMVQPAKDQANSAEVLNILEKLSTTIRKTLHYLMKLEQVSHG